ncbi:MAG: hypothetical protein VB023_00110 [Oscillibacter sp.]|nr:hypothetical protein [Oscillibacter sp.]
MVISTMFGMIFSSWRQVWHRLLRRAAAGAADVRFWPYDKRKEREKQPAVWGIREI